jgi:hypothetical protein
MLISADSKPVVFIVSLVFGLATALFSAKVQAAHSEADGLHIRVGAYNVSFFSEASATEIGTMLESFDLDIAGLTETPRAPATSDIANAMGANYFVAGRISSGQSADKLKGIVSHTPLSSISEINLSASQGGFVGGGESATHANTTIGGFNISVYCLHISDGVMEPMEKLLSNPGFASDAADVILVIGDFNAQLFHPQMELMMAEGFRPSWYDLNIDVLQTKTYDLLPGRGPGGTTRDEGVIDHIMFKSKDGIDVVAVQGGLFSATTEQGDPMSDHAMIWAELVIHSAPEPNGFHLLATGLLGLLGSLRRRHK